MSGRELIILPSAKADLWSAYLYLSAESPQGADKLTHAADVTLELIRRRPYHGHLRDFSIAPLAGIRSRTFKGFRSYLAYYVFDDDSVSIVRILHAARDAESVIAEGRE